MREIDRLLKRADERIQELEAQKAELRSALVELVECCPCQNGCAADDVTCATNVALKTLASIPA